MFELRKFHKNVFVDGNILFDTEKEIRYLDVVCHSSINRDQCDELLIADKIVTQNGVEIHYVNNDNIFEDKAIYHATGEVSSYYKSVLNENNPFRCIYSFNTNLLDIEKVYTMNIEVEIRVIVNRMLYLTVLSVYELFMADIFITCFLRFNEIGNNVRNIYAGKTDIIIVEKLQKKYYHGKGFDKFFLDVFGIDLPEYEFLNSAFGTRNDIAHRYNETKEKELVVISDKDIEYLVRNTKDFVYKLFDSIIKKVYNGQYAL